MTIKESFEKGVIDKNLLLELCESDRNSGICISCGSEASGVEPDARKYLCESCGEKSVYGVEEILISIS